MIPIVRSVAGVLIGLILISLIAEPIEIFIVTRLGGELGDTEGYFAVRNQTPVLIAKFCYNGLAAFAGGYGAAWIAGRRWVLHGGILAVLQTATFVWGMTASAFAGTTPVWAWVPLTFIMIGGILGGAALRGLKPA